MEPPPSCGGAHAARHGLARRRVEVFRELVVEARFLDMLDVIERRGVDVGRRRGARAVFCGGRARGQRRLRLRAAAELCGVAFPPASADEHFRVLSDPACLANVFFDVRGRASVALLREDGLSIGCAQVVPCAVRKEASSSSIAASYLTCCVVISPRQPVVL